MYESLELARKVAHMRTERRSNMKHKREGRLEIRGGAAGARGSSCKSSAMSGTLVFILNFIEE